MNELNTQAQADNAQQSGREALESMQSAAQRNRWIKNSEPRRLKFSTEEQSILGSSSDSSGCSE
jgi:hypothetical protein